MIRWLAARIDSVGGGIRQRAAREGWAAQTRPDIQFTKVAGVQFRYRDCGQGQPIVFAADPPATLEFYDALIERYAENYRVIVFELPAMGFSHTDFAFDFRFTQTNDAIAAFLNDVIESPAILAFSCVAGLGALDIASRHPECVSHLVLIQTPSWDQEVRWKHSRDPKKILAKPIVGQLVMQRLRRSRAPAWLNLAVGRKAHIPQYCECAQHTLGHGAGWGLATAFQNYLTDDAPDMRTVTVPTLAIWGDADGSHVNTDKSTSLWLANGPRAHVAYDDLGHFPELEDVNRVFETITEFIGSFPDAKSRAMEKRPQ